MKKYAIIAMVLVLTLSLLTGCGCTARDNGMTTMPSSDSSVFPTNIPETTLPTEAATMPVTTPATNATVPTTETETGVPNGADDGNISDNGFTEDATRSRSRMR